MEKKRGGEEKKKKKSWNTEWHAMKCRSYSQHNGEPLKASEQRVTMLVCILYGPMGQLGGSLCRGAVWKASQGLCSNGDDSGEDGKAQKMLGIQVSMREMLGMTPRV